MFPGASGPPLLHHVVAGACLPLELLGPQDLVDVVQAVLGGPGPMGVVLGGGVQAAVWGGGGVAAVGGVGVEERLVVLVVKVLAVEEGALKALGGRVGPSCLDT